MRALPLILVLSIATSWTAGCFFEEPSLMIGWPSPGQVFVYEGNDGSSMEVTVLGRAARTDGLQERHDAWILEYVWRTAARPDVHIPIQEAVAVSDGRHLCHDVLCEVQYATWECYKTDEIFFGPAGLAGGLGAGPLWGTTLTAGPVQAYATADLDLFDVTASWIDFEGKRCLQLTAEAAPSVDLRAWMPMTSHASQRIMCDGDILPRQWIPDQPVVTSVQGGHQHPRFTLTKVDQVAPPADLPDSREPTSIPRTPTSGTTAVLSPYAPVPGWDGISAHHMATELDADYKAFLDHHEDAMVVRAEFYAVPAIAALLYEEERAWWILRVANPTGESYQLTVEQVRRTDRFGERTTIHLVRDQVTNGELGEGVPDPRSFTGMGADVAFVYGDRLFGQLAEATWHAFQVPSQHRGVGYPVEDRFYSRTFYVPPDERDQSIIHAWIVEADSQTGRLTYVRLPPEKLMEA